MEAASLPLGRPGLTHDGLNERNALRGVLGGWSPSADELDQGD